MFTAWTFTFISNFLFTKIRLAVKKEKEKGRAKMEVKKRGIKG
jgi:hypothetical protein